MNPSVTQDSVTDQEQNCVTTNTCTLQYCCFYLTVSNQPKQNDGKKITPPKRDVAAQCKGTFFPYITLVKKPSAIVSTFEDIKVCKGVLNIIWSNYSVLGII